MDEREWMNKWMNEWIYYLIKDSINVSKYEFPDEWMNIN